SSFPNTGSSGQPTQTITKSNPTGTMEESLIRLITTSVAPQSWADMGGTGTIEYFAPTMALVINQTPDIQEEIASLLAALRRLQDQEGSIEVRLITISENFLERIGENFNVNIPTENNKHYGQQLEAGQFQQSGLIQVFQPRSFLTGLTPAGTFTSDLNIPIANQSFGGALPPFGGYSGLPGVGGLSLGLAFLSDIQVFLFLEAVQGDQRANIMQAPKLSLFNGQTSTISVTDTQNFLTSVLTGFFNGVPVFQPTFTGVPTGIPNLAMNAIISADRRFVRMSMSITLSNLASDVVPLIPVVVPIF